MTKLLDKFIGIIFISTIALFLQSNAKPDSKMVKIYISQTVQHPAINATTKGVIDGLAEAGYIDGKNMELKLQSAQGNIALANQIAANFVSNEPDVVVGVATLAAQSFAKFTRSGKVKMIFTTVTDPIEANLANNHRAPENNNSGVSNYVDLAPQLAMFKQVKPSIKKLGFLYNPAELNSITLIKKLEKLCPKYDMELVTVSASKSADVAQSAIKLSSLVDAIFISNDNTALSAMSTIVKAANNSKIPVFVSDTDIVTDGAIAALGPNQYEIGKQTAKMIVRTLKGEDPNTMPVEFPAETELFLNKNAAKKLGIEFDYELLKKATKIID